MIINEPAYIYAVVTTSDTTDGSPARGIIVGTGGALKLQLLNDTNVTITVPAGVLPLRFKRVYTTGTTATGLTAIY